MSFTSAVSVKGGPARGGGDTSKVVKKGTRKTGGTINVSRTDDPENKLSSGEKRGKWRRGKKG